MKKHKRHLQTDFVKFILEKYSKQNSNDDKEEPLPQQYRKLKKLNEFEEEEEEPIEPNDDEPNNDEEVDDEVISELINEYRRLKRKYEKRNENNKFYHRR
jgi:hypothetical protein